MTAGSVLNETIAAIATPQAVGGISVIRISGEDAFAVADAVFQSVSGKVPANMKGYTASYGAIVEPRSGQVLDRGVLTVFRAPHSYTGEDVAEISCHGGLLVTREVLRAVTAAGARPALPGEFTKRAFLNGKMDMTQAEAVSDLIAAGSEQAMRISGEQTRGSLYRRIQGVKETLLALTGHLAVWADYPEEDIEEIETQNVQAQLSEIKGILDKLLADYDTGCMLKNGVNTAIVGKPNVGKSTLMNLLARREKSIVTDIPGTTRDVVEDTIVLHDVVLNLADTAGIRETDDVVESFGVQRAVEKINTAQLILALFDNSKPLSEEDFSLLERLKVKPAIAIINKSDLENRLDTEVLRKSFKKVISISAQEESSFDIVSQAVSEVLRLGEIDPSLGMLANERQYACVQEAHRAVCEAQMILSDGMTYDAVTVVLEEALQALLELTGERATEEVVNQVFSQFCVGK